MNKQYIQMV